MDHLKQRREPLENGAYFSWIQDKNAVQLLIDNEQLILLPVKNIDMSGYVVRTRELLDNEDAEVHCRTSVKQPSLRPDFTA